MHIERMHRELKYLYLNAKKTKRLDTSFYAVRKFLCDKQYDRLISIYRTKLTTKDKTLRQRHKTSLSALTSLVLAMTDSWIIPSFKSPGRTYTLHHNKEKCNCSIVCSQCQVCIHMFRCNCSDHSIQTNMCKHVHLLCRYLKETPTDTNCSSDEEGMGDLILDTSNEMERRHLEVKSHLKGLSKQHGDVEETLREAKSLFLAACDLVKDRETANVLTVKLKSTLSLLQCFHSTDYNSDKKSVPVTSTPPNAKMEKQPRFLIKKRKQTATYSSESNNEIVSRLVLEGKFLTDTTE